jgi:serine/threonine protein kinase
MLHRSSDMAHEPEPSDSHELQARVGSTLAGEWRLDRLLGRGGTSAVYAATATDGGRMAIKVLHREHAEQTRMRARFSREGYIANRVGHPGVVKLFDHGVDGDTIFLVMELLEGETVARRVKRTAAPFQVRDAVQLGLDVLEIIGEAHLKGVLHRDIKPENVFLTAEGQTKILDFGLSRLLDAEGPEITQSHATLGTPAFMAPEQALGRMRDIDERTDLWAIGASLFFVLTGRYVHEGEAAREIMALTATQAPRSIASLRPDLPYALVRVIDRALSFDRARRFESALAMRAALLSVLDPAHAELACGGPAHTLSETKAESAAVEAGESAATKLPVTLRRTSRRIVYATAGAALIVAAAWLWATEPRDRTTQSPVSASASASPEVAAPEPPAGASVQAPPPSNQADGAAASTASREPEALVERVAPPRKLAPRRAPREAKQAGVSADAEAVVPLAPLLKRRK